MTAAGRGGRARAQFRCQPPSIRPSIWRISAGGGKIGRGRAISVAALEACLPARTVSRFRSPREFSSRGFSSLATFATLATDMQPWCSLPGKRRLIHRDQSSCSLRGISAKKNWEWTWRLQLALSCSPPAVEAYDILPELLRYGPRASDRSPSPHVIAGAQTARIFRQRPLCRTDDPRAPISRMREWATGYEGNLR